MTSSRFEELEKRCIKLKKARIIRFVFVITSLFIIGFGTYYWGHQEQLLKSIEPNKTLLVVEALPPQNEHNESNVTVAETVTDTAPAAAPKAIIEEILFLAPYVYKTDKEIAISLSEEGQLLKKYNAVQNFDNAYALAYFYFQRKSYHDVIIWAKETSKYNASSEKPWILYAKAKFFLGDRAEAIRSLELFLSYIKSKEAEELLTFYKGQE